LERTSEIATLRIGAREKYQCANPAFRTMPSPAPGIGTTPSSR
jgi:hypothetical protein